MISFIVKYWLEVLFGLIAAGAGALAKKFYNLYKKERQTIKIEEEQALKKTIDEELLSIIQKNKEKSIESDKQIKTELHGMKVEIDILRDGVLSIQGRNFKQDCRTLLKEDHQITQEEWESISIEHDVYKSLSGNHDGDRLYADVTFKYHQSLV